MDSSVLSPSLYPSLYGWQQKKLHIHVPCLFPYLSILIHFHIDWALVLLVQEVYNTLQNMWLQELSHQNQCRIMVLTANIFVSVEILVFSLFLSKPHYISRFPRDTTPSI